MTRTLLKDWTKMLNFERKLNKNWLNLRPKTLRTTYKEEKRDRTLKVTAKAYCESP